jgi:hypothetical protein
LTTNDKREKMYCEQRGKIFNFLNNSLQESLLLHAGWAYGSQTHELAMDSSEHFKYNDIWGGGGDDGKLVLINKLH